MRRYVSLFCTLWFEGRCCHGLPDSLKKKFFVFFDVGVLFVLVSVKNVNFVFVYGGKSIVNVA